MIVKVRLPFGILHVCSVCGYPLDTSNREAVRQFADEHRAPILGVKPDIRVGARVRISLPNQKQKKIVREAWVFEEFFYAGKRTSVLFLRMKEPRLHELCVSLRPTRRGRQFPLYLTYADFLIAWNGDKKKLVETGLAPKYMG